MKRLVLSPALQPDETDFYVFIDRNDSNKIKAKNGQTGTIDYISSNGDAKPVLQGAVDSLSTGSTFSTSTLLWSGGKYGTVKVGPGTFNLSDSLILKPNISLIGSGQWNTFFRLANGHANNNNSNVLKSSMWDSRHFQGGLTTLQRQQLDTGITLRDFSVDGNKTNNSGVTTTTPTPGVESWGHGIAIYGLVNMRDIFVHDCRGDGVILQTFSTSFATDNGSGAMSDGGKCYIENLQSHINNGRGLLLRANDTWLDTYNSSRNGEAGLEQQESGLFGQGPNVVASKMLLYLDAQNHGNQSSSVRDATGFEMRIGRGFFVSDSWIEAPWGPGDNLQIGIEGGAGSSSDYTLIGAASCEIRNCVFDALRKSAIYVSDRSAYCMLHGINIAGGGGGGENSQAVGITFHVGGGIDCRSVFLHDIIGTGATPNQTGIGIVMGDSTHPVQGLSLDVNAYNIATMFKWNHPNNYLNAITAKQLEPQTGHHLYDASTGFSVDTNNNIVDIKSIGTV